MALKTSPDLSVYEGDGGAYIAWTSAKLPVLSVANLGAGKLILKPRGFALPHYADSAKIGYVLQGTCTVGLITPNATQEKVLKINKRDAIPVPIGATTWWFNGEEDSDLAIVFLGETAHSYTPGSFDYFFLTGALGLLQGFSSEFIGKIYGIDEQDRVQKLVGSQTNALILKLDDQGIKMPRGSMEHHHVARDIVSSREINAENFPALDGVGLSGLYERLEPGSAFGPKCCFTGDMLVYVTKGSGRVEVLGLNGKLSLDGEVSEGELFVVQRFFAVALIAGDEGGLEFFAVNKSPRPVFGDFSGKLSAWRALSSPALQASLNVDAELVEYFESKIKY